MTRLAFPVAALVGAAAWLSQGTLAVAAIDGPRIGLLPVSAAAICTAAAAFVAVLVLAALRASLVPLALLGLLFLPWLPVPVPPAFLTWSGSIRWFVWAGAMLLSFSTVETVRAAVLRGAVSATILGVWRERPRLAAGVLAFAIFGLAAWRVAPLVPSGDEPHYLIIAQSLLLDHDLKIENNHRRGDYQAYHSGPLAPHYIQRGRDGEIYSIHAPGLPALILPAFAIGGYRAVVVFLMLIAASGSALAWHVGWLTTRKPSAAWFGWAAVTLSATTIFHSFTIYPDGVGAVLVLTGIWALLRAADDRGSQLSWMLHGAALALLPWLHSRFALLAGAVGALVILRLSSTRNAAGKAVSFLAVPALSALGWMTFFIVIYGIPDPSAPYGGGSSREFSLGFVPGGLTGLLFDQRFGLIANAPVLLFALGGLALMFRPRYPSSDAPAESSGTTIANWRLALELLFVIVPYLVTATSYAMWWGGWSAPARFAYPAVPILAIPAAVAWARMRHRATVVFALASLAFTAMLSFVLVTVDGGRLAYNTREATALWLDWASRVVALGDGAPAWFRGQEGVFARDVAIWAALFAVAWWMTRAIESRRELEAPGRLGTAAAAISAFTAMIALSVVWQLHGESGVVGAPAQIDMLRRLANEKTIAALQVSPPRLLDASGLLALLRIESFARTAGPAGMGRNEQPLIVLPSLPAGRYRVEVRTRRPGGWLMLGIGQDQFSLWSQPLASPPVPIEVDFPVDVRALVVRGDEEARRAVTSVAVEPMSLVPSTARLTDLVARRTVKYADSVVYFLDENSFPEPEAFWSGGRRQTSIVVQPDPPSTGVDVQLRNAPVDNRVTLESGQWREDLTLGPGEERQVKIPIAPNRRAALVTISSATGFRPSEVVPDSRDQRFLGVWIKP